MLLSFTYFNEFSCAIWLALVYQGVLVLPASNQQNRQNGQPQQQRQHRHMVAVKVLHPDFARNVERDLWLMETVAKLLHNSISALQMVNVPSAASTFAHDLRNQADLRLEATNLHKFRHNFYPDAKDEEKSDVYFPKPVQGWVTEQVLVEDYVKDATPIAHYLNDESPQGLALRKELSGPLLRAFLKMVFLDNCIHGTLEFET